MGASDFSDSVIPKMESPRDLHSVVRAGDLEALLELLTRGVNANMTDEVFFLSI